MARKTPAQRQATYRKRHPEKIAAYRAENKHRQDTEYRERIRKKNIWWPNMPGVST